MKISSVGVTEPIAKATKPIAIRSSNRIEISIPLAPRRSVTVTVSGMGAIFLVVSAVVLFLHSDWFSRLWDAMFP